jgi:hypothetical protein
MAAVEIVFGGIGVKFGGAVEQGFMAVAILRVFWLVFSGLAVLFFPEAKAPIWAPLVYVLWVPANIVFVMAIGSNIGHHTEPNPVISYLRHTRAPLFYAAIAFGVIYAGLNVMLLRFVSRASAAPSGVQAADSTVAANAADKTTAPPAVNEQQQPSATEAANEWQVD